jgi:hypothetical protein
MDIHRRRTQFSLELTPKQLEFMKQLSFPDRFIEVTNPFSKDKRLLCPEAVALYDVIKGFEIILQQQANDGFDPSEDLLDKFHMARDIFRANWPKDYMALLD